MVRSCEDRTLDQRQIDQLSTLLLSSLRAAAEVVSRDPEQMFRGETFLAQNFETFSELVSRLCFRLPQRELESLCAFAIDMYNSTSFRGYPYVYRKTVDVLLKRVGYAMAPPVLLQKVGALLALPVANEPGFEVANSQLVNDPLGNLEWPKNFVIDNTFDRSSWTAAITRLINLVKHGDPVARDRAIHRLLFVREIGALTEEEMVLLREALWSRLDEKGLPANRSFYLSALLRFPPPNLDDYSSMLKEYMLDVSIVDTLFFREVVHATVSAAQYDDPERRLLTWDEEQVLQLFLKAREWWTNHKATVESKRNAGIVDLIHDDAAPIHDLLTLLRRVILPNFPAAENDERTSAMALVDDIRQSGYSVLVALPLLLVVAPNRFAAIAQQMRTSINSTDREVASDGIVGLFWWCLYASSGTVPKPPPDLLIEWANKIAFRRQPELLTAIIQMSILIDKAPDLLTVAVTEPLITGLEYLLTDTTLPPDRERAGLVGAHTSIRIEERPDFRAESMRLAGSLHRYFESKSESAPDVLLKWGGIAESDPLPEVRYAWTQPR